VSPSAVESYEECGLNWVVSALGGDTVMPPTAGIGTIVHEAMERVPDGDLARMREIVEEHWPELDFETAWIGRKERRRADLFIDRLHLNDLGNNALAKVITAKLGLAQERYARRKVTPIKLV
jgi:hypothetical protein